MRGRANHLRVEELQQSAVSQKDADSETHVFLQMNNSSDSECQVTARPNRASLLRDTDIANRSHCVLPQKEGLSPKQVGRQHSRGS